MQESRDNAIAANLVSLAKQLGDAASRAETAVAIAKEGRLQEAVEAIEGMDAALQAARALVGAAVMLRKL